VTPERREAVGYLKEEHELSERRACEAVRLSRRAFRYVPQALHPGEYKEEQEHSYPKTPLQSQ